MAWKFIVIVVVAYLFGNLNISRLIAKTRKVDIDSTGSGNPGMSNMLRNAGVIPAVLTLLFDAAKCVLPIVGAYFLLGGHTEWEGIFRVITPQVADIGMYVAALSCILGHMFPVFNKFKGGKGVACGFGLAIVAQPILTAILFACYLIILVTIRISSVGSLFAAFSFIITDCVLLIIDKYFISLGIAVFILISIVWAHRSNIVRLINRKENLVDLNKSAQMDKDYFEEQRKKRAEKNK